MSSSSHTGAIYILYGVAGIGKSTVSKTLAERAAKDGALGASFFFSRDEDNRKTARWVFSTLAYHLAVFDGSLAAHIDEALERDPDASGRDIRKQFNTLIAEPLQLTVARHAPILFVIDALDECEDDGATAILTILAHEISRVPGLKVFITTRPEQHIRSALVQCHDHTQFHMQDIEHSVVETDIQCYLQYRLSDQGVQQAFPEVRHPSWRPTKEQVKMLVGMSGKLFIIARTAADFILDPRHAEPAKRIAMLLDGVSPTTFSGSKHVTVMDDVYMRIIRDARPDPADDWDHWFRIIVGTIVLLHDLLSCESLANLLGVDANKITGTLSNLHSLLAPPKGNNAFHVHHKSFPDFICSRGRCRAGPEFYIEPAVHHMMIAECSLRVMCDNLKLNICNLPRSDWSKDWPQLRDHIHNSIPRHLAYACTYWASHLVAGLGTGVEWNNDVCRLLERFATQHLLNWVEAVTIIGRVDMAYSSLEAVGGAMVCRFISISRVVRHIDVEYLNRTGAKFMV